MAIRDNANIEYFCDPNGINEIIDELSPTSFTAIRKVKWNEDADYKYDLRRYFIKQDETEMPGKGTSINNPDRLVEALLDDGIGSTENIFRTLVQREDSVKEFGIVLADMDDGEYSDFKDSLDESRQEAIKSRGMSAQDFLGEL